MSDPTHLAEPTHAILKSRVGRRLVALLLGCALLPLAVFAWVSLTQVSGQLSAQIERSLHANVKSAGMALADRLLTSAAQLDVLVEIARAGTGPELDARLLPLRRGLSRHFDAVWIQGRGQARNLLGEAAPMPTLRPDQQAHLASGKALACTAPAADDGRVGVQLLRRIDAGDGQSPLLVGEVRGERLGDVEALRGSGAEVFVLAGDGRQLLLSSLEQVPDLSALHAALVHQPASGTLPLAIRGTEHLASYWRVFLVPQLGMDCFVVQARARGIVEAPLSSFQWTFGLTALLTFLVVVLASLLQVRNTLVPIRRLLAATRAVAGGDLDARAALATRDEFGELGRSFDDMTRALVDNIRRREQTETALVAARDAALAAARVKTDFLTNVSHELRTPLTAIVSAAEILSQFGGDDPAVRGEFLDMVHDQSQRLCSLIDGVLEFSAARTTATATVCLRDTLGTAVAQLPRDQRGRVALEIADPLPPVAGDEEQLVRLFGHLLDNALKFSPPGEPVAVRARAAGGCCTVEVADRGIGIAASDLGRIFEPFCQVGHDIMTSKPAGVGLGLTLARNIAELHGGRLAVESEPGRGSTFRVTLPVPAAAVSAP